MVLNDDVFESVMHCVDNRLLGTLCCVSSAKRIIAKRMIKNRQKASEESVANQIRPHDRARALEAIRNIPVGSTCMFVINVHKLGDSPHAEECRCECPHPYLYGSVCPDHEHCRPWGCCDDGDEPCVICGEDYECGCSHHRVDYHQDCDVFMLLDKHGVWINLGDDDNQLAEYMNGNFGNLDDIPPNADIATVTRNMDGSVSVEIDDFDGFDSDSDEPVYKRR